MTKMMDRKHIENFNFHNTQEQLQFVDFRFKDRRKMPFFVSDMVKRLLEHCQE